MPAPAARPFAFAALCLAGLAACSPVAQPENIEPAGSGGAYQAQYRDPEPPRSGAVPVLLSRDMNGRACLPPRGGAEGKGGGFDRAALSGEWLSRGDLLALRIAGDNTFSGDYEVSADGLLRLPFLAPVPARGRAVEAVEADVVAALRADGFYADTPRVSLRVLDLALASVGVTGAVFEPRPVDVGEIDGGSLDRAREDAPGGWRESRDLASALRAAGGIRPDADLTAVELRRGERVYRLDLSEVILGRDRADIMLLTGDEIHVPSRGCFQDALMVPSPISPPGVTLFLSNLTQPAAGNALAAVGRDVREVPWGTRFMQAAVDLNCVGGARATNARRAAAIYSRNPLTGVSVVVERDVEAMMRRADRDDFDPYLLPGDAMACYDSVVTNIASLGAAAGALPAALIP